MVSPCRNDLTAEYLRERIDYNPVTGQFFSVQGSRFGEPIGARASNGYIKIGVNKRSYLAHRLAWLYVHGKWPDHTIDHINGNRADNRIENLRDMTLRDNIRAGGERYMDAWREARRRAQCEADT